MVLEIVNFSLEEVDLLVEGEDDVLHGLAIHLEITGEESFFGRVKLEYPRLKKKHDIRWMDIQRPLLLEPCVDYKLIQPCIRVNLFF